MSKKGGSLLLREESGCREQLDCDLQSLVISIAYPSEAQGHTSAHGREVHMLCSHIAPSSVAEAHVGKLGYG